MRLLVCLCLLSCAALAQPRAQLNEALAWQYPEDKLLRIPFGSSELLLLHQPYKTPQQRGQILILNDTGKSAAGRLHHLAEPLANAGWSSYTMALPMVYQDPEQSQQQSEPANTEPESAPEAEITSDATQTAAIHPTAWQTGVSEEQLAWQELLLIEQINAYQQQIAQQPGFRLVIAEGLSAAWIAKLVIDGVLAPDGLILIGPYWPNPQINTRLNSLYARINLPLLDVHSDVFNLWSVKTSETRKVAAQQAFKPHYHQYTLPRLFLDQPGQYPWLSKRILGWTRRLGW